MEFITICLRAFAVMMVLIFLQMAVYAAYMGMVELYQLLPTWAVWCLGGNVVAGTIIAVLLHKGE